MLQQFKENLSPILQTEIVVVLTLTTMGGWIPPTPPVEFAKYSKLRLITIPDSG